jgi:hypothetical protein
MRRRSVFSIGHSEKGRPESRLERRAFGPSGAGTRGAGIVFGPGGSWGRVIAPGQIILETGRSGEGGIVLTKSEMSAMTIPIDGIDPRLAGSRARREKPRLFENMASPQPAARAGKEGRISYFFRR